MLVGSTDMETKPFKCIYALKNLCLVPNLLPTDKFLKVKYITLSNNLDLHFDCYRKYRTIWMQNHMERFSDEIIRRLDNV